MPFPRTGGQILVDPLPVQGSATGFGVPGERYTSVVDAIHGVADRFTFILRRHETAACNMAEAAGKLRVPRD